jgi:hypothetical protein
MRKRKRNARAYRGLERKRIVRAFHRNKRKRRKVKACPRDPPEHRGVERKRILKVCLRNRKGIVKACPRNRKGMGKASKNVACREITLLFRVNTRELMLERSRQFRKGTGVTILLILLEDLEDQSVAKGAYAIGFCAFR